MPYGVYISTSPSEEHEGLSLLNTITPEIIPHEDFHRVSWLCACKNPSWYYYAKREHGNAYTNKFFLSSVDEPLKEFVRFLHRKNIFTTPSCSGHHKSVKEFERIYAALKEDKKKINKKGLCLKDIETGKRFLFRNEKYHLPWTQNEFILKIMQQQEKGIIGLRLNGYASGVPSGPVSP